MGKSVAAWLVPAAVLIALASAGAQRVVPDVALTDLDFFQLHDLNARFNRALDSGDAAAFANLFTQDGTLLDENGTTATGHDQLAALAAAAPGSGPTHIGHYYLNLAVDAVPGGAAEKVYEYISVPQAGQPNALRTGQYWDELVKTLDGWRFQKRTFHKPGTPRPNEHPLAITPPRLGTAPSPKAGVSADDFAQIQQLYARYAHFWDRPFDGGRGWAGLFTPDGTFVDAAGEATTGRASLQELILTKGPWEIGTRISNVVVQQAGDGTLNTEAYYIRRLITAGNAPAVPPAVSNTPKESAFGLRVPAPGSPEQPAAMMFAQAVRTKEGWQFKRLYLVLPNAAVPNGATAMLKEAPSSQAQTKATVGHPTAQALTATDYAEISHLYARYAHGIDSKANDGALLGNTYTPDASFRTVGDKLTTSRADLMDTYARIPGGGPAPIVAGGHATFNIMIEPGPSSTAIGYAYFNDGSYVDMLVKTPEGWRFKVRNYRQDLAFPLTVAPRPIPAPPGPTAR